MAVLLRNLTRHLSGHLLALLPWDLVAALTLNLPWNLLGYLLALLPGNRVTHLPGDRPAVGNLNLLGNLLAHRSLRSTIAINNRSLGRSIRILVSTNRGSLRRSIRILVSNNRSSRGTIVIVVLLFANLLVLGFIRAFALLLILSGALLVLNGAALKMIVNLQRRTIMSSLKEDSYLLFVGSLVLSFILSLTFGLI